MALPIHAGNWHPDGPDGAEGPAQRRPLFPKPVARAVLEDAGELPRRQAFSLADPTRPSQPPPEPPTAEARGSFDGQVARRAARAAGRSAAAARARARLRRLLRARGAPRGRQAAARLRREPARADRARPAGVDRARPRSRRSASSSELVHAVEKLRNELRFADRGYSGFFAEAEARLRRRARRAVRAGRADRRADRRDRRAARRRRLLAGVAARQREATRHSRSPIGATRSWVWESR